MTASCMTCIYSQLTKEQYPCSECYYDNNGNPSKHEPVVEAPDINVGNMDTISRQQAIDALLGITAMRNTIPLDSAIFNIKKLPSVQPDIIRCKDCEYLCNEDGLRGMCWHINGFGTDVKDKYNSFCSWAERRE